MLYVISDNENIKTVALQHANIVGCFNIFTNKNEKKNLAKSGIQNRIRINLLILVFVIGIFPLAFSDIYIMNILLFNSNCWT